ncbi:hypothetical protein H0H87_004143 [Tephrocybe sp. NHM501043]|nr:hypothetical protein H0H87_004143 [Tephrocybe sp. NHM501043]
MGLSGRRVKQRIPADPRNLAWADDAAKFGSNYLSKFGWDASKGLGLEGDGRTSHIKVTHKLDMLGIGAAHQKDPNGIAWKQNKDFENLLKRLNENISTETTPLDIAMDVKEEVVEEEDGSRSDGSTVEKKRKRNKDREGKSEEKTKKRRKKDAEDRAGGAQTTKSAEEAKIPPEAAKATEPAAPAKPFVPRNRAHRARAIASKAIASKSSAHIAEILGIAPTPSTSSATSGAGTPVGGKLTPLDDGTVTLEKLTTSTKSVADYFKEKLLAKTSKSGTQTPTMPRTDIVVKQEEEEEDSSDAPRGLGAPRMGLGSKTESLDSESQRIGLSKFSSLMSSAFLSATSVIASDLSTENSTPSDSGNRLKVKKEERKMVLEKVGEDDSSREIKKIEKKRRENKGERELGEGEVSVDLKKKEKTEKKRRREKHVAEVAEDIDGNKSKKEKKEKRRKDKEAGLEVVEEAAADLPKEERRRLRKEKKNCKGSSPG